MNPKRMERKSRFERITEALDSIYKEVAWRDRKGDHRFGMGATVLESKTVTSRAAGGPVMKTMQFEPGTRGIQGLSRIADALIEAQKVEQRLLKDRPASP